jgi:hypothetical protein
VSSSRTSHSTQELRQLIAMLEQSGIAEQRPEARALLLRSRALLRERQRGARRVAGKLGTLLTLILDAAMLGVATVFAVRLLAGPVEMSLAAALALAGAPAAWLLFRLRHLAHWLGEAARWAAYHLAWLYDWFAEAVSLAAMARLDARIAAREVMWGWRQHRRGLPHRPRLEDVGTFLASEYGPEAARAFHRQAEAVSQGREWTTRGAAASNRAAQRLAALRWSALIALFGQLAASGALWPDMLAAGRDHGGVDWPNNAAQPARAASPQAAAPGVPETADTPERAARRADLRDLIRRKRQDITAAFGWHLKTEAEITQRDNFLAQTRAEIAELERELAQLGG